MKNENRGLSATCTPLAFDHLADIITRAIGLNDPYPHDEQLAAHRGKQVHNERFMNIESKEIAQ